MFGRMTLGLTLLLTTSRGFAFHYVDQRTSDVTVVSAAVTDIRLTTTGNTTSLPSDITLNLNDCSIVEAGNPYVLLDCSVQTIQQYFSKHPNRVAPLISPVIIRAFVNSSGDYTSEFNCRITEIRTFSRESALKEAHGLGFYISNSAELREIHRNDLRVTGYAQGRNGESYIAHSFFTYSTCWNGTMSSSMNAKLQFRPYMQFWSPIEDTFYRNWDSVPTDYILSPSGVQQFDRQSELIDHSRPLLK